MPDKKTAKTNKQTNKKQKNSIKSHIFGVLIGAVSGVLIALFLEFINFEIFNTFNAILFAISAFLAYNLQIIIHEGGHLVFGLLSGYTFGSFRIGSFIFLRENGKPDGKLVVKRFSVMGTGGQCLMLPPMPYSENIPVIAYNFGGVVFNLIFSLIFAVPLFFINKENVLFLFLILAIIIGVAFAILNGVPMCIGEMPNDGYNAKHLAKDKNAHKSFWAQLAIIQKIANGTRLKDMPNEYMKLPEHPDISNPLVATMFVFHCNRMMDELDFEKAEKLADELLNSDAKLVLLHTISLEIEKFTCMLLRGADKNEIEKIYTKQFEKYLSAMRTNPTAARAQLIYAMLYLKDEKAIKTAEKNFEKAAKNHPYPCEIISEKEIIAVAKAVAV